jgi:hypothetical protein
MVFMVFLLEGNGLQYILLQWCAIIQIVHKSLALIYGLDR